MVLKKHIMNMDEIQTYINCGHMLNSYPLKKNV